MLLVPALYLWCVCDTLRAWKPQLAHAMQCKRIYRDCSTSQQYQYQLNGPSKKTHTHRLLCPAVTGMASVVAAKLAKIVATNQLQAFYPPERLQAITAKVTQTVDFHALAARCTPAALLTPCADMLAASGQNHATSLCQQAAAAGKHLHAEAAVGDAAILMQH